MGKHNAVEEFQVGDCTVYIVPDDDADPPWNWDNLGSIAHWHTRADIGGSKERINSPMEFLDRARKEELIYLPLALYDHGGFHIWVGDKPHAFDSAGWDSGQVGFIYTTKEKVRAAFDVKRVTWGVKVKAELTLRNEVETLDIYYKGDVYGYIIEKNGEEVDSCWGFYGFDYAREEARSIGEGLATDGTVEE